MTKQTRKTLEALTGQAQRDIVLGATGRHPDGRLTPIDEGELRLAVEIKSDKVVVNFSKPVAWIGFDADQALDLVEMIRRKALEIKASTPKKGSDKGFKKTVCIDLDGVLARYDGWKGEDHIGDPNPGAADFMRRLCEFARVVVFTTRTKADIPDRPEGSTPDTLAARVKAWLCDHGIPHHEVYVGQGKPLAAAYVDDRAVGISTNPSMVDFDAAINAILMLV